MDSSSSSLPKESLHNNNSLLDLLLGGNFRRCISTPNEQSTSTENEIQQLLAKPALTYIDSDWNIATIIYRDLVDDCRMISEQLKINSSSVIENIHTDCDTKARLQVPATIVIYGDCAQWTPVFMIAAHLVSNAFCFIEKCDKLKQTLARLPKSIFSAFITHKYRLDELTSALGDVWDDELSSTLIIDDYYLISTKQNVCPKNGNCLDIAYLISTSGTSSSLVDNQPTSVPSSKYIFVPHQSLYSNIVDFQGEFRLTSDDTILVCSPFTFDPSLCDLFLGLSSWSHVILISSTIRNSPQNVAKIFRQFRPTYTTVTPSLWRRFTGSELYLSSLRFLNFGGERSVPVEQLQKILYSTNGRVRIYNFYGLTEVSAWAALFCLNDCKSPTLGQQNEELYYTAYMPILGRPLRDTQVYLEGNQIVIESPLRKCLIYGTDGNWRFESKLLTGDLAATVQEEAGQTLTFYLKRACENDFIKLNGVKCFLPCIELAVMRQFANGTFQVAQCFALPGDWHEWRQSIIDLVLLIIRSEQRPSHEQIKRSILQHLCGELRLPFAFRLHLVEQQFGSSILSANGKLDQRKLRDHLENGSTTPLLHSTNTDQLKSIISCLIASILNVDLEELRTTDKQLRHLGMESMAALQITMELEQALLSKGSAQADRLFEVVLGSSVDAIVEYVKQLLVDSESNTIEPQTIDANVDQEEEPPFHEDIDQKSLAVGRHTQLHQTARLDSSVKCNRVSISRQWSYFMEECVDASPLIIVRNDVTYLITASHSGLVVALEPLLTSDKYRHLWSSQLSDRIEASPAASTDGSLIYLADYSGLFYALHSDTGRIAWKHQTGDQIKCTPTARGCFVLCGSHDQHLYCWRQLTGHLQWKLNVANSGIFASPVLVIQEGITRMICGTLNGTIASVSIATGARLWSRSIAKTPIFSTPLPTSHQSVVVGLTDSTIVSVSISNGDILWSIPTAGPVFSSPVSFELDDSNFAIYGIHGCEALCLCTRTGAIRWRLGTGSVIYSSPLLASPCTVIILESDATLHCVDALTGERVPIASSADDDSTKKALLERVPLLTSGCQLFSSPILHRGRLFVGARDSCVHCFALETPPTTSQV